MAGGSATYMVASSSNWSNTSSACSSLASLPIRPCGTSLKEKLNEIHAAEADVLDLMPDTSYCALDVPVHIAPSTRSFWTTEETEYTIRTVVVGKDHMDKPPIVLIHGFMMGSAGFFKLLPLLAKERTVYAVDIIGMGGSGRPPFNPKTSTAEEAEKLLVEPLEQWAEAMGLSKFVLLGHSFGGFVAACWATRRPDCIACLGLLSPLLGFSDQRIDRMRPKEDTPWRQKVFFSLIEAAWAYYITPQTLIRNIPGVKGWFERTSKRRFSPEGWVGGMTEEEGRLLSEYLVKTLDTPASTESTAQVCFGPWLRPIEVSGATIKSRVAQLKVPTFAVYGDRDWMDRAQPSELSNCAFTELENSGHHLYLDNPSRLASEILSRAHCAR